MSFNYYSKKNSFKFLFKIKNKIKSKYETLISLSFEMIPKIKSRQTI